MSNSPPSNMIAIDPAVMGGKPCIRGMRVTVSMIVGLLESGSSESEILFAYPYLAADDLRAASNYSAELRKTPNGP